MENKPMNGSDCLFKQAKNIYIPAMSVSDSGIEAPTDAPSFELSGIQLSSPQGHKLHPFQSLKAGDGAVQRHPGKPPLMPVAFHKTSGAWRQRHRQPALSPPSHSLHAEPHYEASADDSSAVSDVLRQVDETSFKEKRKPTGHNSHCQNIESQNAPVGTLQQLSPNVQAGQQDQHQINRTQSLSSSNPPENPNTLGKKQETILKNRSPVITMAPSDGHGLVGREQSVTSFASYNSKEKCGVPVGPRQRASKQVLVCKSSPELKDISGLLDHPPDSESDCSQTDHVYVISDGQSTGNLASMTNSHDELQFSPDQQCVKEKLSLACPRTKMLSNFTLGLTSPQVIDYQSWLLGNIPFEKQKMAVGTRDSKASTTGFIHREYNKAILAGTSVAFSSSDGDSRCGKAKRKFKVNTDDLKLKKQAASVVTSAESSDALKVKQEKPKCLDAAAAADLDRMVDSVPLPDRKIYSNKGNGEKPKKTHKEIHDAKILQSDLQKYFFDHMTKLEQCQFVIDHANGQIYPATPSGLQVAGRKKRSANKPSKKNQEVGLDSYALWKSQCLKFTDSHTQTRTPLPVNGEPDLLKQKEPKNPVPPPPEPEIPKQKGAKKKLRKLSAPKSKSKGSKLHKGEHGVDKVKKISSHVSSSLDKSNPMYSSSGSNKHSVLVKKKKKLPHQTRSPATVTSEKLGSLGESSGMLIKRLKRSEKSKKKRKAHEPNKDKEIIKKSSSNLFVPVAKAPRHVRGSSSSCLDQRMSSVDNASADTKRCLKQGDKTHTCTSREESTHGHCKDGSAKKRKKVVSNSAKKTKKTHEKNQGLTKVSKTLSSEGGHTKLSRNSRPQSPASVHGIILMHLSQGKTSPPRIQHSEPSAVKASSPPPFGGKSGSPGRLKRSSTSPCVSRRTMIKSMYARFSEGDLSPARSNSLLPSKSSGNTASPLWTKDQSLSLSAYSRRLASSSKQKKSDPASSLGEAKNSSVVDKQHTAPSPSAVSASRLTTGPSSGLNKLNDTTSWSGTSPTKDKGKESAEAIGLTAAGLHTKPGSNTPSVSRASLVLTTTSKKTGGSWSPSKQTDRSVSPSKPAGGSVSTSKQVGGAGSPSWKGRKLQSKITRVKNNPTSFSRLSASSLSPNIRTGSLSPKKMRPSSNSNVRRKIRSPSQSKDRLSATRSPKKTLGGRQRPQDLRTGSSTSTTTDHFPETKPAIRRKKYGLPMLPNRLQGIKMKPDFGGGDQPMSSGGGFSSSYSTTQSINCRKMSRSQTRNLFSSFQKRMNNINYVRLDNYIIPLRNFAWNSATVGDLNAERALKKNGDVTGNRLQYGVLFVIIFIQCLLHYFVSGK